MASIPRAPAHWMIRATIGRRGARYQMRGVHLRMQRELGPVVRTGRGSFDTVLLFGPDANRMVLLDREQIFSAEEPWTLIMGGIFPNGLLLRDGDDHRHHRKIMHETFKRPVLREYAERMGPAIEAGLERFEGKGRLRAFDAFKALTLDLAASIFVGVDLGPEAKRMNGAFEAMVAASMPGLRLSFAGRYKRGLEGRRTMREMLGGMIAKKRDTAPDAGSDLFTRLCHARSETGDVLRDDEVLDHMIFLMMAAHDTTTSALTSLTWELARHPHWQDRIREESRALPTPHPGFDELDGLPALTWAMYETLRLYPPLPVIPRIATRSFEWQGHPIEAGTMVVVSPVHTHVMDEWWDGPLAFDPERFSPEREEQARHTHHFIPFGGGRHMCIGRRFAEAQIRLVAHQLVRRFRWSVPDGYTMPVQQAPISKPSDGLPIDLEPA